MLIATRKIITTVLSVFLLILSMFSASCGSRLSDKPDENLPEPETQGLVQEVNCDMKILFLGNSITLHSRRPTSAGRATGDGCKFEENDYVQGWFTVYGSRI